MADCVSQRFCESVVVWKGLRHPNILPVLGVTMDGYRLVMVSEWLECENINEFVKEHPDKNRLELVGFSLRSLPSLFADTFVTAVACRCYQGSDIYARSRNHPWKSPGGMYSNNIAPYLAPLFTRP